MLFSCGNCGTYSSLAICVLYEDVRACKCACVRAQDQSWHCVRPASLVLRSSVKPDPPSYNTRFSHYRFSLMTQICSDVLTEGYKSASEATCRRQRSEEAYMYILKGTFGGFGCEWKDGFSSWLQKASSDNKFFPPKIFRLPSCLDVSYSLTLSG